MKLLKYLLLPFSILAIVHFIFLPACSKDDDIKAKYDSQLLISWSGVGFTCPFVIQKPPTCPTPEQAPENCPCQVITSFRVTVSNFLLQRLGEDILDPPVGEPFDLYRGKSYQFDIKAHSDGNPFVTPDFALKLEPSMYQVVSFQLDDFQVEVAGLADLTDKLNEDLHASITLPITIVPRESRSGWTADILQRKFPLQEGWTRNLYLNFACSESIKVSVVSCVNQYIYSYSFDPNITIVDLR